MENRSTGGGRGRGRGRTLTGQDPPASPPASAPAPAPAPEEPPHADRYEAVQVQESPSAPLSPAGQALRETFDAMYVAPREGAYPCESDRGRSRGRGAGRGRTVAAGLQPGLMDQVAGSSQPPPPSQDHGDQFSNDSQLPGTPPEPAGATPRQQSSPESVIDVEVAAGAPADTLQNASIQSGRGSTVTTVVPEKPVVNRSGTKGTAVPMKTNYMRLKLKPGHKGIVEYHVSIQPQVEDVRMRRQLVGTAQATEILGQTKSFDGMILFLPYILDSDVTIFQTHLREDVENQFKITVTYVKVRPMSDCIVFFNILLNRILRQLNYKEIRREFYDMDMRKTLDQHKLEIWPGTSLCTENQEDGLMICVDTSNRVLRQDTVLDHLNKIRGNPNFKATFEQFIINKIVITKYNYKCYKIDEVAWDMQPVTKFNHRGKEVNFKEYLKRYPTVNVTDDQQPMLISKLKPRKNERAVEGEGERLAALVPECCYITGLTEDQKQNFKVMTDLADSTRIVPAQRVTNLDKFINRVLGDEDVKSILGNWGLYIEKDLIEVVGRQLDGPNLQFAKGTRPLVKAGPDFSRESGKGVYEPIVTRRFVVICTGRDSDKAKAFIKCYQEVAKPLGINMMESGEVVVLKGMNPSHFNDALKQHCPKPDSVQFVVVVMPGARDDIYSAIKRYCIANVPVPSQCIVSKTLGNEKRLRSIVIKIALQINCKLGGSLWALQLGMPPNVDVMFIGIDAAHDPLKKDASVMCLVASLNNECTKFFSKSSTSKVHQELADSLQLLTVDALQMFHKHRGKYPDRIVVFRDGGSLGSFEQMESSEAGQMKKAAFKICGEELKFTFTVVTKRIPQRFFAKINRKIDNPQPGSIVDSVVTRRHYYDFYIVSQQVRQGTVNPTHFVILDTDDQIKPDLIQKYAYATCFQYFNWSGTVRVPAMVQYAHKLSALLIRHVKAAPHRDISTTLYYL